MKFIVEEKTINHIPILDVYDPAAQKPAPIIIILHGFNGCKELQLKEAFYFVRRGFFVTLLDAYQHGGLQTPKFRDLPPIGRMAQTHLIIAETTPYIDQIIDNYPQNPNADASKIGLFGLSMGGSILYRYLTQSPHPNLKAAVALISTPKSGESFQKVYKNLPISARLPNLYKKLQLDESEAYPKLLQLGDFPLLMLNGVKDPQMLIEQARQCYNEMKQSYRDPKKIKFIEYRGVEHQLCPEMMADSCRWFEKFLV
jgi:dienelactone hydrolase